MKKENSQINFIKVIYECIYRVLTKGSYLREEVVYNETRKIVKKPWDMDHYYHH